MICSRCGYVLGPFDPDCPRCARQAASGQASRVKAQAERSRSTPTMGDYEELRTARSIRRLKDAIILVVVALLSLTTLLLLSPAPSQVGVSTPSSAMRTGPPRELQALVGTYNVTLRQMDQQYGYYRSCLQEIDHYTANAMKFMDRSSEQWGGSGGSVESLNATEAGVRASTAFVEAAKDASNRANRAEASFKALLPRALDLQRRIRSYPSWDAYYQETVLFNPQSEDMGGQAVLGLRFLERRDF
jgi:hypothetical protein